MRKTHKATLHLNRHWMDSLSLSFPNVNLHDFTVFKENLLSVLTYLISLSLRISVSMSESFFVLFKNFWVFIIALFEKAPIENPGMQMIPDTGRHARCPVGNQKHSGDSTRLRKNTSCWRKSIQSWGNDVYFWSCLSLQHSKKIFVPWNT